MSAPAHLNEVLTAPERTAGVQEIVDQLLPAALQLVESDTVLRVPRTDEECRDRFAEWLSTHRARLAPTIRQLIDRAVPAQGHDAAAVEEAVWSRLSPVLLDFAVRGRAVQWVSRHLGDATTIGWSERTEEGWRIPLGVRGHGENLGQMVLDPDGRVVEALTSTRSCVRDAASQGQSEPRRREPMEPDDIRAWKRRWQLVNEAERDELRRASGEHKFRQLAALMASARMFPITEQEQAADVEVRRRWNHLRRVLGG